MNAKIVVPGQSLSRQSAIGDAEPWGSTSRLLWKVNQAVQVVDPSDVYVCATKEDLQTFDLPPGIGIIAREGRMTMDAVVRLVGTPFPPGQLVLWLNSTFPFFGPRQIRDFMARGHSAAQRGRGAVTGRNMPNIVVDAHGKSSNFVVNAQTDRSKLNRLLEIVPAASLARAEDLVAWQAQFRLTSDIEEYNDLELVEIGSDLYDFLRGHEASLYLKSQDE